MKNLAKIVVVGVFLLSTLLTGCNMVKVNPQRDRAEVAARVKGEVITKGEVLDIYNAQKANYGLSEGAEKDPQLKAQVKQLKESILDSLIQQKVLQQKAKEKGLALSAEENKAAEDEAKTAIKGVQDSLVEQYKQEAKTDKSIDPQKKAAQAVQDMLKQQGLTEQKLIDQYRQSKVNKKLTDSVMGSIKVTDADVQKYYNDQEKAQKEAYTQNPAQFETDDSQGKVIVYQPAGFIRVKHILFKIPDEDQKKIDQLTKDKKTDEAKKIREQVLGVLRLKAQSVLDEIHAGADFDKLMETVGEDPGMRDPIKKKTGYLLGKDSSFLPEFKTAALKLQNVGDLSEPVATSAGIHIIKLVEKVPEGPVALDKVKDALQKNLTEEKKNTAWKNAVDQWTKEANVKKYPNVL